MGETAPMGSACHGSKRANKPAVHRPTHRVRDNVVARLLVVVQVAHELGRLLLGLVKEENAVTVAEADAHAELQGAAGVVRVYLCVTRLTAATQRRQAPCTANDLPTW